MKLLVILVLTGILLVNTFIVMYNIVTTNDPLVELKINKRRMTKFTLEVIMLLSIIMYLWMNY